MISRKRVMLGMGALAGLVIAVASAVQLIGTARAVDVVALFAGAFYAGSAVTQLLREMPRRRTGVQP
jgi:hypothetical protein